MSISNRCMRSTLLTSCASVSLSIVRPHVDTAIAECWNFAYTRVRHVAGPNELSIRDPDAIPSILGAPGLGKGPRTSCPTRFGVLNVLLALQLTERLHMCVSM